MEYTISKHECWGMWNRILNPLRKATGRLERNKRENPYISRKQLHRPKNEPKPKGRKVRIDYARADALLTKGVHVNIIAERLGCSPHSIRKHRAKKNARSSVLDMR